MRFKRRQWSARAAMRKREAIQPRKLERAEVDVFLYTADSNTSPIKRGLAGSAGVNRARRARKGSSSVPGRSGSFRCGRR